MEAYILAAVCFCAVSGFWGWSLGYGHGYRRAVQELQFPETKQAAQKPGTVDEKPNKVERKVRPSWQAAKTVLERDTPGEREDKIMAAHKDVLM